MSESNPFMRRLRETLDLGLESSRKAMDQAARKTRELEDYGILKLDIRRLENRSQELLQELGVVIFSQLTEEGKASVSLKNSTVSRIVTELEKNRDMRIRKEEQLKALKRN